MTTITGSVELNDGTLRPVEFAAGYAHVSGDNGCEWWARYPAEIGGSSVESTPIESNGVAFIIKATRKSFDGNEPLELQITFHNITAQTIWLPRYFQILHLDGIATGKHFTGVTTRSGGLAGLPQPPPIRLRPYEVLTSVVTFENFGFVQGNLGYAEARSELFRMANELRPGAPGRAPPPQLPPGMYRLAVEVRSPDDYRRAIAITLDNAARCKAQAAAIKDENYEYHDDECRINDLPEDFDPAHLWNDDVLRSNPIELEVALQ
jgi:hypothetical protein